MTVSAGIEHIAQQVADQATKESKSETSSASDTDREAFQQAMQKDASGADGQANQGASAEQNTSGADATQSDAEQADDTTVDPTQPVDADIANTGDRILAGIKHARGDYDDVRKTVDSDTKLDLKKQLDLQMDVAKTMVNEEMAASAGGKVDTDIQTLLKD